MHPVLFTMLCDKNVKLILYISPTPHCFRSSILRIFIIFTNYRNRGCLSSGCYYKILQTGELKQQTFISHSSEYREVQDLGVNRFGV